jgi:hypothetical protein|nr:MAG TPA: hypothetical protein [Caudoviricetes sp.]
MSISKFRAIKGSKFLKHIDDTLKCGNRMPILFPDASRPVDIIQWQVHPSDDIRKDPVIFYYSLHPNKFFFFENIEDWVFVQRRINNHWEAKPMKLYGQTLDGESFHIKMNQEVFENYTLPNIVIEDTKYRLIGVQSGPTGSKITVLTHQDGTDEAKKWVFEKTGEFCYNWEKDAWIALDNIRITHNIGIILDTLDLYKDLKTASYFVSGKGMTFIEGHQSPTGGFDEYVFRDGDEWVYFHSTKNTSLTTKKGLNSTQLHLNHVRRIQVD